MQTKEPLTNSVGGPLNTIWEEWTMRSKTVFVLLLLLCAALLLTSCAAPAKAPDAQPAAADGLETVEPASTEEEAPAHDLKTSQVTIWALSETEPAFVVLADLTDAADIQAFTDSIDLDRWTLITGELPASEPTYYIDFHNGLAVSLDGTSACGQVGRSFTVEGNVIVWDKDGFEGWFTMNDAFLEQVLKITGK